MAHGATGKGNDQVRFELTYKALAPHLAIIAPWREWELQSREDEIAYAKAHQIPLEISEAKPYSRDRNLWHISHEGSILEDPWLEPEEEMYVLSVSPEKAPDQPAYVTIDFEQGNPVAVDGQRLDPVALLEKLNDLGGRYGIGRVDMVENRLVGIKSHGVYETPGGTLLFLAHRELETLALDRETAHYKEVAALKYADLVYNGQWWSPLREALDAFFSVTQAGVTGSVRLKLYKGNVIIAGRKADHSLYREDLATFGASTYSHADAKGFINLFGLPNVVQALTRGEKK